MTEKNARDPGGPVLSSYFLDTSALVKRYHEEAGSHSVDRLFQAAERNLIISDVSIIEFYSAIAKKVRIEEIDTKAFTNLRKRFAHDLNQGLYEIVRFGESEKRVATRLITRYATSRPLRTLDAIQLALVNYPMPKGIELVTALKRLRSCSLEPLRPRALLRGALTSAHPAARTVALPAEQG
ncbi:MAG: type II toxin-antitoxin system VapC family toxin [Salinibacter sp.]